ncbi:MAG: hypothetical protein JW720_03080 [Sedimentisphaerales bacterium]|nr:hypothetical protein [Sedimentisphaerales bacterium]
MEVMRGKLECFESGARRARELFEEYLSHGSGPEKQSVRERLLKVLASLGKNHKGLVNGLIKAMKEDE